MWAIIDKDGKSSLFSNTEFDKKRFNALLKERKEYSLFRRFKHGKITSLYGILFEYALWKGDKNLKENCLSN
jgi:hypothetical protein